jgi:hypothetical protein
MAAQRERTGVLVVRVWIEADDDGLRARLTGSLDIAQPDEEASRVAGSIDEIVAIVRDWLELFMALN